MILNFEQTALHAQRPLVLIHGLFGSIGNLGMLARGLQADYSVIQVDVRNHGHSPHAAEMPFQAMAQDIIDTLDQIGVREFGVIGHSMGGKIAMQLTAVAPKRVQDLVVLDMSPFAYRENHHDQIFKALFAVQQAQPESRKQATEIMQQFIQENMVNQFLLKSFDQGQWRFNLNAIFAQYAEILNWQKIPAWSNPALFIRGGRSHYISTEQHHTAIAAQFPQARLQSIDSAGHWLHAEQPQQVLQYVQDYLNRIDR